MSRRESSWPFPTRAAAPAATSDFSLDVGPTIARAQELLALERAIAEEAARVDIECYAVHVPSTWPTPVYDVSAVVSVLNEPELLQAYQANIDRAVRYLDLREMLVRPDPSEPRFVAFKGGA